MKSRSPVKLQTFTKTPDGEKLGEWNPNNRQRKSTVFGRIMRDFQ